jgi:hypothetical protein
MGMAADIARSLRRGPRQVMREHLARGPQEARALAFLMIGCLLVWVAQWPRLLREAQANRLLDPPGAAFDQLAGTALFGWVMVMPLLFYFLAFVAHQITRLAGGGTQPWSARLALFWAWLAAAPLALLSGVTFALAGGSAAANLTGILWVAVFAAFWAVSHQEAARRPQAHAA